MENKVGKSLEQMIEEASAILDEFEASHNLIRPAVPTETEEIMGLTYPQLEKLSAVQCAEYAYQLAQYAYYVQRVNNRESATLKWLQNMQLKLVSDK